MICSVLYTCLLGSLLWRRLASPQVLQNCLGLFLGHVCPDPHMHENRCGLSRRILAHWTVTAHAVVLVRVIGIYGGFLTLASPKHSWSDTHAQKRRDNYSFHLISFSKRPRTDKSVLRSRCCGFLALRGFARTQH